MIFNCPECGTRQRGGSPGAVMACGSCKNPIVVPEAPPEPEPVAAPQPTQPADGGRDRAYGTAVVVVLIVAVAHIGLYLLLTADARGSIRTIEARHAIEALESAERPDDAPKPGTPAYAPWRRAVELHDDAKAWRSHGRHVGLLKSGFIASFLVQLAITGWILVRVLGKHKARERRRAAES